MMNSKKLRRLYLEYNRKWFDGRLPKQCAVVFKKKILNDYLGLCYYAENIFPGKIVLSVKIRTWPKTLRRVLLHEMVHLAIGKKERPVHGKRFDRGMLRLARTGAFHGFW